MRGYHSSAAAIVPTTARTNPFAATDEAEPGVVAGDVLASVVDASDTGAVVVWLWSLVSVYCKPPTEAGVMGGTYSPSGMVTDTPI